MNIEEYSIALIENSYSVNLENENGQVNTAIVDTVVDLISRFPEIEVAQIWRDLYKAHVKLRAQSTLPKELLKVAEYPEAIQAFKSADQSWLRASGVAFENICKLELNPLCEPHGIKLHLPSELLILLRTNRTEFNIDNEDEEFFTRAIAEKDFDLFATLGGTRPIKSEIFGFIQCKSSIRDRIQENTRTSYIAMEKHFWSIVIALDDDNYLALPKFNSIAKNFWNGFYVIDSRRDVDESIFPFSIVDDSSLLIQHMLKAKDVWQSRRHRLTPTWRP